jgi:succinate dehydrogenase / fumarate reductase cytochrome b subunit
VKKGSYCIELRFTHDDVERAIIAVRDFHILDLTTGTTGTAQFQDLRAYENLVYSFRRVPVAAFYIVAMLLLCMHLYHGLWSMFQSMGVSHPRYTPIIKRAAAWVAILMAVGFISIPASVLTGLVGANL